DVIRDRRLQPVEPLGMKAGSVDVPVHEQRVDQLAQCRPVQHGIAQQRPRVCGRTGSLALPQRLVDLVEWIRSPLRSH
ncbi:MAG TPA: hypothetical protein VEH84_07505, partial [Alphaproteobacteria bacterium]|nr:hypothetical protein [Alphaproteobacteria bacterium]